VNAAEQESLSIEVTVQTRMVAIDGIFCRAARMTGIVQSEKSPQFEIFKFSELLM